MKDSTDSKSKASPASESWQEEFNLRPRYPRIPFDELRELVSNAEEPKVFLSRAGKHKTEITVSLPVASSIVSSKTQKGYLRYGVTLSRAFDDVLWQKLEAEKSTTWAEVTNLVRKAYRQAWLQWFRLQFLGHSHPMAEAGFKKLSGELEHESKVMRRGRQRATQAEIMSLHKRYDQLLPKCRLLHRAATREADASSRKINQEIARKKIRLAIWERVRRSIHGMTGDGYIFGGEAFSRIRRTGKAQLHEPATWEPHQLAMSLLSLERQQAYQTIEKKIVPTKYRKKS